jgi:hypothetical protein
MAVRLTGLSTFLVAFLLGTLYAALIGLVTFPLRSSFIAWPIWIVLFWLLFWKVKLHRLAKYLIILPLSILLFEVIRTAIQPPIYAFQNLALDRSHYAPGLELTKPQSSPNNPVRAGDKAKQIYIGEDGFRADPQRHRGNPARCHHVLIGDSMIYGCGLAYADTLRPVLKTMGVDACVYGVTGNSPIDYLATLKYVQDRIEDGAQVAIYVYAYNDFVSLRKYLERGLLGRSPSFVTAMDLINYYDDWRRTTFIQGYLRKTTKAAALPLGKWRLKIGATKEIEVVWPHDPAQYQPAAPLDREQRATFEFFLERLRALRAGRPWRVLIVFIPDNDEMLANLAHPSSSFEDLDPRRVEALRICAAMWSDCHDLTRYLYQRAITAGQFPFLLSDRHLSRFGNQIVAEHYLSTVKGSVHATALWRKPAGDRFVTNWSRHHRNEKIRATAWN